MPTLTLRGSKFVWQGRFEDRELAKGAGFRWSPDERCWWTSEKAKAFLLVKFADEPTRAALEGIAKAVEASRATDAQIEIPAPAGLTYLPYQKAGIAGIIAQIEGEQRGHLLADEMGLGKTVQALGVVNLRPQRFRRVLIVTEAGAVKTFLREAQRWLVEPKKIAAWSAKAHDPEAEIVLCSYDYLGQHAPAKPKKPGEFAAPEDFVEYEKKLASWKPRFEKAQALLERLHAFKPDLVVFDEAHNLRNTKAARTKAAYAYLKATGAFVLFMTGTPILNKPMEMQPALAHIRPTEVEFANYAYFGKKYCAGTHNGFGWDFSGSSNEKELNNKLRALGIMTRRLKEDVLKELPPRVWKPVIVEATGALKKLVEAEQKSVDYQKIISGLENPEGFAFTEMAEIRASMAREKTPAVVDYVERLLEEGVEKVVVFAHHYSMLDGLMTGLKRFGVVRIDGRTNPSDRADIVAKFQAPKSGIRVFIGGIKAAGVALTLTAAHHVVFGEAPWHYGLLVQAADRCHRIGQKSTVFVHHLVVEGTIDAHMAQIVVAKQKMSNDVLDERAQEPEAAPEATSAKPAAPRPLEPFEAELIGDVLFALRGLASVCDGAYERDDRGFSRFDSHFGKSLAARETLTRAQAGAAARMLRKYRGQLADDVYRSVIAAELRWGGAK